MFETIVFYAFAAILLGSALCVVTARNPVHAALFLVLSFFTASAIWLLLRAEFLALTLMVVYVGAVMVLFLFVVMMLDVDVAAVRDSAKRAGPLGGLIALLVILELGYVVTAKRLGLDLLPTPVPKPGDWSNTLELGREIYTRYIFAFEVAGVILLVGIVAAIALTLRRRGGTRSQDPAVQVSVKRGDRVRMVKLPSEERR